MTVATTSTDECSASEISAREPIAMPTANFATAMLALAKIEIAATLVLMEEVPVMGGGLVGHRLRVKLACGGAIATHLQEGLLRIVLIISGVIASAAKQSIYR